MEVDILYQRNDNGLLITAVWCNSWFVFLGKYSELQNFLSFFSLTCRYCTKRRNVSSNFTQHRIKLEMEEKKFAFKRSFSDGAIRELVLNENFLKFADKDFENPFTVFAKNEIKDYRFGIRW